jgi:large subunit ribosomal protein L22
MKAVLKNVSISPKKTRIPADIVRGMNVVEALATLRFMPKSTAGHVAKVVKSAAFNALNKDGINPEKLVISEIRVDKGKGRIKHYSPKAKGGGYSVWIRGKSHITVILKKVEPKAVEQTKEVDDAEVVAEPKKTTSKTKKPAAAKKTSAKKK